MGRLIEGFWDCQQCGKKKIRGRYRDCPACGKARGDGTKFYMAELEYYEGTEVSREADWYCEYCNSLNSAHDTICYSCGSSKGESKKNYFDVQEESTPEKEIKSRSLYSQDVQKETLLASRTHSKEEDSKNKTHRLKYWIMGIASVFLFIALLVSIFMPKETALYITEKQWERSIEIQEYRTVVEHGWSIPEGGRKLSQKQEIHHYDTVIDHYETVREQKSERYISGYESVVTGYRDLGNGYFEEIVTQEPIYDTRMWVEEREEPVYKSIPVYQTKYTYEIERWVHKESLKSEGTVEKPYWPEVALKSKNEREGSKKEIYEIVTLDKKDREKIYDLPYSEWVEVDNGDEIKVKISLGRIMEIIE